MEEGKKPTLLSPSGRSKNMSWDLKCLGEKKTKQAQPEPNTNQTGTLSKAAMGISENHQNDEENVSGTGPPRELCKCPLPQALSTFRNLQGILGNSFSVDISALDLFRGFRQTTHLDLAIKTAK